MPAPANETIGLQPRSNYDLGGGMVTHYNFTKLAANQLRLIKNGDINQAGAVENRLRLQLTASQRRQNAGDFLLEGIEQGGAGIGLFFSD